MVLMTGGSGEAVSQKEVTGQIPYDASKRGGQGC